MIFSLPVWTILVGALGLAWYLQRRHLKYDKLKKSGLKDFPGPKGWPIFGNSLDAISGLSKKLAKWAEEYGDLYKLDLMGVKAVVISDPKLVKEIFSDPAFSGRLNDPAGNLGLYEGHNELGIFNADGEKWEVHRRFLLRQLRDFGFGKSSMEALITDEVTEVLDMYKKTEGTPVGQIRKTMLLAAVNSLWRIVSSKRYAHDDPQLLKLAEDTTDKFNEAASGAGIFIMLIPWLRHVMPEWSGYNTVRRIFDQTRSHFEKVVAEKKKTFKEGDQNDFIDVYLTEMKKHENDPESHFYGELAEKNLVVILFHLFLAGTDTTATTINWTILYLCKNPSAQKKLQREIEEVTSGNSRKVSVSDRPNMPYALALVDEVLRCSSIVPMGVSHRAMMDKEFQGYLIEKDVLLQPNLRCIHYNPKIWGDPENFRPERFLTPDGKKYVKNDNVQAFQPGRRVCVGETLARDSLFLYITNLFQQFDMKFDPSGKEPSVEPVNKFLDCPEDFTVIMTDRLKK